MKRKCVHLDKIQLLEGYRGEKLPCYLTMKEFELLLVHMFYIDIADLSWQVHFEGSFSSPLG